MTHRRSLVVLASLLVGLALGSWLQAGHGGLLRQAAPVIESVGGVWLNALRMTVGPLVFALLVSAIAGVSDAMATGRLARRAVAWFGVLLLLAGTLAVLLSLGVLALWPVDPQAAAAFVAGAGRDGAGPVALTSIGEWLKSLVPANIVQAAADDAILALVVFATLFGFAATRLPSTQRDALTGFFTAMAEAMIVVVHWILLAAPVGVFALALGVGLHAGLGAASILLQYVATVSLVIVAGTLVLYPIVGLWGPVPLRRFAVEIAPVQVVAASTQSSLATLPAMIECARDALAVPQRVAGLVLPLAVAVFRYTSPMGNLAVCFFIAALYGFEPGLLQMATAVLVAFAVSVAAVGLPGQVSFITSVAPICLALGLPVELLGILIAVEMVPDVFRTIGNVTGDLAVTTLVQRHDPAATADQPAAGSPRK
jgi:proton glutamate symport protein